MVAPRRSTPPPIDLTAVDQAESSVSNTPAGDSLQDIIAEAIRRLRPVGRSGTSTSPRSALNTPSSWLQLPTDLVAIIALHCGQKAVVPTMRLVCKDWRDALDAACVHLKPRVLRGQHLATRYVLVLFVETKHIHKFALGFPESKCWTSAYASTCKQQTCAI